MRVHGTGDLELSCFHLLDATEARVDAAGTLTASVPAATGALANLQDADLATGARWAASSIAGLILNWDFAGTPVDVAVTQIAGADNARFLLSAGIQWSDNGTAWTEAFTQAGITWPGVGLTTVVSVYGAWSPTEHGSEVRLNPYGDTLVFARNMSGKGVNARSTGTYQFEVTLLQSNVKTLIGVMTAAGNAENYLGSGAGGWGYASDATKYLAGSLTSYGAAYVAGDVIGVVVDFTAGSLTCYKNGVSQGAASATGMLGLTLYPAASNSTNTDNATKFLLREVEFAYPVAGASAWGAKSLSIAKNAAGSVASTGPATLGTGPTIIYGIPRLVQPTLLTVESGSIRDYTTGMLGQGIGRVRGDTVKTDGVGGEIIVSCKCRLIREKDGLQVRELWSDPLTGIYDFRYVDELQLYTVLTYDHTGAFRAVVADGQVPELMP